MGHCFWNHIQPMIHFWGQILLNNANTVHMNCPIRDMNNLTAFVNELKHGEEFNDWDLAKYAFSYQAHLV